MLIISPPNYKVVKLFVVALILEVFALLYEELWLSSAEIIQHHNWVLVLNWIKLQGQNTASCCRVVLVLISESCGSSQLQVYMLILSYIMFTEEMLLCNIYTTQLKCDRLESIM